MRERCTGNSSAKANRPEIEGHKTESLGGQLSLELKGETGSVKLQGRHSPEGDS